MLIPCHKQASTTLKIRTAVQESTDPAWMVAERYGISAQIVWNWRSRDNVHDRSHTAHKFQSAITPAQEAVAVALRKSLLLPQDDLLSVLREFVNPDVSRSGLDRCVRRHGVGDFRALKHVALRPAHKPFKTYEPGHLHVDVKYLLQMADEDRRRFLFVAIAACCAIFEAAQMVITINCASLPTCYGKEFKDRLIGLRRRFSTGNHDFDRPYANLGIEHRLPPSIHSRAPGTSSTFDVSPALLPFLRAIALQTVRAPTPI